MTVVSSWGCLGLGASVGLIRLITAHEESPPRPASSPGRRSGVRTAGQIIALTCTSRAMAHRKPTISRAIAVVTTTFGLPAAISRR